MKIVKEVIFRLQLDEEELLLLQAGIAHTGVNSISEREKELAQNMHLELHQVLNND